MYSTSHCIQKNRQTLSRVCRFLYSVISKNLLTNPKLIVRLLIQSKLKPKTSIGSICDDDCAAVELDSVFYNGKSQTCTTLLAGATFVHTIESLKEV